MCGKKYWKLYTVLSYPVLFTFCTCCILRCLVCIVVVVLCVLLSPYVYLLYYVCIAGFTLDAGLLVRSGYSEGPATGATSTQAFLGFLVSISKCCDGSQNSKLPLRTSHVALPT